MHKLRLRTDQSRDSPSFPFIYPSITSKSIIVANPSTIPIVAV